MFCSVIKILNPVTSTPMAGIVRWQAVNKIVKWHLFSFLNCLPAPPSWKYRISKNWTSLPLSLFTVAYLLKARTVESEKQPLLANSSETTFVSRQRPRNKRDKLPARLWTVWVAITWEPQQTRTQQWYSNRETVFSTLSVQRWGN
jgi:hypothetical protein